MKPLFKCEVHYYPSSYFSQLFDGFEKLRKMGIVEISIIPATGNPHQPLLKVKINNKYTVIYDAIDGLCWIDGSIEENLNYFKNNIKADFYFKRSCNNEVINNAPHNCSVYPLGLIYPIKPKGRFLENLKSEARDYLKNNYFISKAFKLSKPDYYSKFYSEDFEYYPIPKKENKILFLTRLWDPDKISSENKKKDWESINKNRINFIKACQAEFGKYFLGGVTEDSFSIKHAKELTMPLSITKKGAFLKAIKEHNICIATTGLHNSIGFKFGEYVAASRAIISEPLNYDLPGSFRNGRNYFSFSDMDELLNRIYFLQKNKDALFDMMNNNFHYYNNYVRPDKLVLNTLLTIYLAQN